MALADRIAGILLIMLCFLGYLQTFRFTPDAGMFPRLVMGLGAFFSLVLLIGGFRSSKEERKGKEQVSYFRLVGTAVLAVLYVIAISVIGFFTATPLFLVLAMLVLGQRSVAAVAIATVSVIIVVYIVFQLFLYVPFPRGIFM